MPKTKSMTLEEVGLNRRIRNFYRDFSARKWEACFDRLDPKLRDRRVDHDDFIESLSTFFDGFGPIVVQSLELTMYLNAKNHKYDDRPFAYGLLHWQDKEGRAHILRERWVKSGEKWYTRMVGLV
jgi:hypothetical protein